MNRGHRMTKMMSQLGGEDVCKNLSVLIANHVSYVILMLNTCIMLLYLYIFGK